MNKKLVIGSSFASLLTTMSMLIVATQRTRMSHQAFDYLMITFGVIYGVGLLATVGMLIKNLLKKRREQNQ